MQDNPKVRTCLWFDGDGEEAAEFYVSLLPDSVIEDGASSPLRNFRRVWRISGVCGNEPMVVVG